MQSPKYQYIGVLFRIINSSRQLPTGKHSFGKPIFELEETPIVRKTNMLPRFLHQEKTEYFENIYCSQL